MDFIIPTKQARILCLKKTKVSANPGWLVVVGVARDIHPWTCNTDPPDCGLMLMSIFLGGEVVVLRELFREVPDNPKNLCNESSFQSFGCQGYHLNWFFITLGTCAPKQKRHIYIYAYVYSCVPQTSFPCHCWYTPPKNLPFFHPEWISKFFEVDENYQPRNPPKWWASLVRNLLFFQPGKNAPHFQGAYFFF